MSRDSDCALDGQAMKAERKERLEANRQKNLQVFENHRVGAVHPHTQTVFVRLPNRPACDYYLIKNKWKGPHNKIYHGSAVEFFAWLEKQHRHGGSHDKKH